jgi:hypothetical protein
MGGFVFEIGKEFILFGKYVLPCSYYWSIIKEVFNKEDNIFTSIRFQRMQKI